MFVFSLAMASPYSCKAAQTSASDGPSANEGPWCSRAGRLTVRGAKVKCSFPTDPGPVTFGLITTAYQGALPKCDRFPDLIGSAGVSIAVTVESVQPKVFPVNGAQQLETWVDVVRTDVSSPCGMLLNFTSLSERPQIVPGAKLIVAARTIMRSDTDIPSISEISTDSGELLYALILSASVSRFSSDLGDLLPGLQVGVGTETICTTNSGGRALAASFSTGSKTCWFDSQTSGCCTLWGREYEIDVLNATAEKGSTNIQTGFALRAEGFFTTGN
jgi:hypothetical protein